MCRIAGLISKKKISDPEPIQSMLAVMRRGGPDDTGLYCSEQVCFGHNRLAIIDTSKEGQQPMKSLDDSIVLTFNGEIYNYQEIRKKLQRIGFLFKSNSDTEVIIRAYEYWGIKCVGLFEGIFAFSLYDKKSNKVFLVRDYPGVKPVYYSLTNNELVFASEVKAFKAFNDNHQLTNEWEALFLAFGFLPYPFTTLKGVIELAPGSMLEVDLTDFSVKKHDFFRVENNSSFVKESKHALRLVKEGTEKAIIKNLISDAPIGVFLSGGLDSSIITALADRHVKRLKTISVNFDESEFDESKYQRDALKTTKHTEHTSHRISKEMFWEALPEFWQALDQPTVDGVNAFFISKCAKDEGLKAVVSGIGADELFGGYVSFKRIFWMRFLKLFPNKKTIGYFLGKLFKESFSRLVYLEMDTPVGDYLFLRGVYCPKQIAELTNSTEEKVIKVIGQVSIEIPFKENESQYVSFLESKLYLRNQLLRDFDTMGMWHGLEVRVPFLDIKLIKTLSKIHTKLRFKGNKYLLRKVFEPILPPSVVSRKKKGFTFPFGTWLMSSPEQLDESLDVSKPFLEVRNGFMSGKIHWSKLWVLIVRSRFKELNTAQMGVSEFYEANVSAKK